MPLFAVEDEKPVRLARKAIDAAEAKARTAAFLWEIGCEEIPASWLARTMRELEERTVKELEAVGLEATGLTVSGTLRRLIVHAPAIGIQYFIWEADRRGLNVIAPDVSGLFEPPEENW